MDPTISVSKGCFVYKSNALLSSKTSKSTPNKRKYTKTNVLSPEITSQPFYNEYSKMWKQFSAHITQLQQLSYTRTLDQLVEYVQLECNNKTTDLSAIDDVLPTIALLTGINQLDHLNQFRSLTQCLHEQQAAHVCLLQSRDCASLKTAIEFMVYNFIESSSSVDLSDTENEELDIDRKRLRRTQCTMKQLNNWYRNNYNKADKRRALVVILSDFECFTASVLQDFILILSAHRSTLPLILVLGVATSIAAVHSSLHYHVSSKIRLRVLQMQAAPTSLNELIDKVVLSPRYGFHLSGKALKFLTHIFLYYDFSTQGFIQGFKFCLMEHYFMGNAYALCTNYSRALTHIKSLTHDDMETIRRLPSFRAYVEQMDNCKRIIAVLTDDDYLKKKLPQLLRDCQLHLMNFRCCLEFLAELVGDLPRCPLGKLRRELYANCLSKPITAEPEFKECWQMLGFMAKDEFVSKINKCIARTECFVKEEIEPLELGDACAAVMLPQLQSIKDLLAKVETATMETSAQVVAASADLTQLGSRQELKTYLLQRKQEQPITGYAKALQQILHYMEFNLVQTQLRPLSQAPPLHELYIFSDISTVRRNIIGAPRAALHTALHNPHFYLQCKCCELPEHSQLLSTLPDLSVVYKLHLECGRMINLFDWMQAFWSVLRTDDDFDEEQLDPQIQARFTRAVAELQFLGYIKMSKRKTDHATRLTW